MAWDSLGAWGSWESSIRNAGLRSHVCGEKESGRLQRWRPSRRGPALERGREDLVDRGDKLELEVLAQMLGDLVDVLFVERRGDYAADLVALSGERLLL